MASFNRMDICAAHYVWAVLNNGTTEAAKKFAQLDRIGFKPGISIEHLNLSDDNAIEIAMDLGLSFADVTRLNTAELGSVSEGTLRSADLLEAFADALESLVQNNAEHWCGRQGTRDTMLAIVWDARELDAEIESDDVVGAMLDSLTEQLNYFAPAGATFGAHEGDGADFGFWTSDEHRDGCYDCDDCTV